MMIKKILRCFCVSVALGCCWQAEAADFASLIPRPAGMEQISGTLSLPSGFKVSVGSLPQGMADEAVKFVNALNLATGLDAAVTRDSNEKCLIDVVIDPSLPTEGYGLKIKSDGIDVKASGASGLFYAFQTLKKLLPPNVMAGRRGDDGAAYELPLGQIDDRPRFEYRGFMLDVSRHFFDAQQIMKMLDLMAAYKLNRFHWHLTDDQGWRLPVEGYPELTASGATNRNILRSDFSAQTQWRDGDSVAYGPYAYTVDEIRAVVAYAADRHIEVIPEIDMPGHMVAAIHSYPEFSTDPASEKLSLHEDFSHNIWNKGGVSRDVLDVSNPDVMRFVRTVVDVLADLFPSRYIHIGGDECPTLAWENSDACAAKMKELGLTDVRALQSWFTKEVADYARERHGRMVMGWNELITEGNADMEMIKAIDPVIFCWLGGEDKAEANGLRYVYTPFNGGYYINRSYADIDQIGAGRDGALALTINVNPPAHANCIGVQGTFWTEQVDRYQDLEYLALPRLLGIAEQGWSAETDKDYDDFRARVAKDTEYLDLAEFNYGSHQLK
ncbi:MAG: beta-N-acetylhexosaminidase [Muribaculaceae bacterium]|nr:beta-N-acetylhexosaminidase [Muribaculaceae bacterium]